MAEATKGYEVAYLIRADLPEEAVQTVADGLRSILGSFDAEIDSWDTPRRRILAYPISKEREAYVGAFRFRGITEKIPELAKKLSNEKHLLRTMLLEWKKQPERRVFIKPATVHKEERVPTDEVALEAKLEEILGGNASHESQ